MHGHGELDHFPHPFSPLQGRLEEHLARCWVEVGFQACYYMCWLGEPSAMLEPQPKRVSLLMFKDM